MQQKWHKSYKTTKIRQEATNLLSTPQPNSKLTWFVVHNLDCHYSLYQAYWMIQVLSQLHFLGDMLVYANLQTITTSHIYIYKLIPQLFFNALNQ